MKKILILIVLTCHIFALSAQVYSYYLEDKSAFSYFPALKQEKISSVAVKEMSPVDVKALLAENDELKVLGMDDIPFRFGKEIDVNYTLEDGVWTEENDRRIWRLKILSKGAYSLNFIFSEFMLADSSEMYIYSIDGRMVYGPITEKQNDPEGIIRSFSTDLIAGEEVVIQLSEPIELKKRTILRISKVVHGYIDMLSDSNANVDSMVADTETRSGTALSCHLDVNCYPDWKTESDGVVRLIMGGGACSGGLINNTAQDNRPFILTAFHCIDTDPYGSLSEAEKSATQYWVVNFQYKSTQCNSSNIRSWITYNGADFRAGYQPSDFVLAELKENIAHQEVSFLGWNRNGSEKTSATGIHHPKRAPMKISFKNDNISLYQDNILRWSNGTTSPKKTHWRVTFDEGGTENVSSGSPLFDVNHRVIGQLHGGDEFTCNNKPKAYYGSIFTSWDGGGTSATRLKDWLDPLNTGAMTLDGKDCSQSLTGTLASQTVKGCDVTVNNATIAGNANVIITGTNSVEINSLVTADGARAVFDNGIPVYTQTYTTSDNELLAEPESYFTGELASVGVEEAIKAETNDIPKLYQNHPNPFTGQTTIGYYLPEGIGTAWLRIMNTSGATVKTIDIAGCGEGSVMLDANILPPDIYFYNLLVNGEIIDTRKMAVK